jgi:hypothetical protein
MRPGEKGTFTAWTPALLAASATADPACQDDEIGERDLLAAGAGAGEVCLAMPSSTFNTLRELIAGWLTGQSFCGASRMRAPLAPPRLSEPRKVEAEAQAVLTSSDTESPEARICA